MSIEILKRKLNALRVLEKVKKHEKAKLQSEYSDLRVQYDDLVYERSTIDAQLMSAEVEMQRVSHITQSSLDAFDVKMDYLEGLGNIKSQNHEALMQLNSKLNERRAELLKATAQQQIVSDHRQKQLNVFRNELLKLEE
jgi:ABC-type ATPase involved in cell division